MKTEATGAALSRQRRRQIKQRENGNCQVCAKPSHGKSLNDEAAPCSALVWSKKRPTKEGLYWMRYYGQVRDIVRLTLKEGSIKELTQMFYGKRVPLRKLPEWGWEWAGPIPEPIADIVKHKDGAAPGSLHSLVSKLGVTVAELKRHIANWPETDATGEPTEVWIETGKTLSSPCMTVELLNYRIRDDGSPTSDLLLCPATRPRA